MSSTAENEVIVVGAGPGGLFLACELMLAGVRCTVLERRTQRSVESRAVGLQARTLELLAMRGIVDRFLARGHPHSSYRVTVGSARIDLRQLDTPYQQLNICPQSITEELLEERARELGARIERDARVLAVRQDTDGVTVTVRSGECVREERASWVVGCDGTHSAVRESAGIEFSGKTYPYNVTAGDVRLAKPPSDGMLVQVNRHGLVAAIDFGNGWWRMGAVDRSTPRPSREPVSIEELREILAKIFDYDLEPFDSIWTSRFQFHKGHASTYRCGRVLLAGDAAHVHAPLGAQGLNITVQDAMNLGWKLAAVIQNRAPEALLDTYEHERRPVATRVLAATDLVTRALMSQRLPVRMLRRVVVPMITSLPRTHQYLAGQISNVATAYPPKKNGRWHTHLVGQRLPNLTLRDVDGNSTPLFDLFHTGRFVFIDQSGGHLSAICEPWRASLVRVQAAVEGRPLISSYGGILCRPDGYCAWAGGRDDALSLRAALQEWCGEPRPLMTSTT
jgi:2-polyprenyl-6-methoxyphenol hydroxylase-like FAD-dependent oxidoreductase